MSEPTLRSLISCYLGGRGVRGQVHAFFCLQYKNSGLIDPGRRSCSREIRKRCTPTQNSGNDGEVHDISAANSCACSCERHRQNRAKPAKRCDRGSFWPRSILGRNTTARGHPAMPGRVSRRRIQRPGTPRAVVRFFRYTLGSRTLVSPYFVFALPYTSPGQSFVAFYFESSYLNGIRVFLH